jgi:hypothetical protein
LSEVQFTAAVFGGDGVRRNQVEKTVRGFDSACYLIVPFAPWPDSACVVPDPDAMVLQPPDLAIDQYLV